MSRKILLSKPNFKFSERVPVEPDINAININDSKLNAKRM